MSEPTVIIAGISLLIVWTVTVLGGASWLQNQLKMLKEEVLKDFNSKHEANKIKVEAMEELLIRHDTILNPDFQQSRFRQPNGKGSPRGR